MVEINLLPEELRKKKSEPVFNLNIEAEKLRFLAIGGAAGILILIIKAVFAHKSSNTGYIIIVVFHQMCGYLRSIQSHGPEFGHFKNSIIPANAVCPENNRPFRGYFN